MTIFNARSHFSLGESLLSPEQIVEAAKNTGEKYAVLTDTMRIAGMADFIQAANKAGIKPIIGARLKIVEELVQNKQEAKKQGFYYIRLIVLNEVGYRALTRLLSIANDNEHFFSTSRLLLDDVINTMPAGSAVVTLGDMFSAMESPRREDIARKLASKGLTVGVDLIPIASPYFQRVTQEGALLARKGLAVPFLSFPLLYSDPAHSDALDLMRIICSPGMKLDDRAAKAMVKNHAPITLSDRFADLRNFVVEQEKLYGTPAKETMQTLIDAAKNNAAWADKVTFKWEPETPSLPKMADDEFKALVDKCKEGWKTRFLKPIYGDQPKNLAPYEERLKYELSVLQKLKFAPYFLMVAEVVQWSKSQGIRVGPGRGSAAGSLVAYLMGITDIDPIRFNLLFERFINPDRIDLPDADLDFMSSRREEVFEWIRKRFGDEYVASVSNYTTIAGAGALKDVSSALGVEDIPAFGKWIEKEHGVSPSLEMAIETSPELSKWVGEHPEVLKYAEVLEDRMRSYGKHAAGVIVAGKPLSELCVVETRDRGAGRSERIVAPDKTQAENFGLVKLDVLGLATLDMVDIIIRQVQQRRGIKIDLHSIPLDDHKTLVGFGEGKTTGVFQFESMGMKNLLRQLATKDVLTFDDIAAATALYRPGPMDSGLLDQYVAIKKGEADPSYPHPSMEEALKNTQGVMIYQENVMGVARDLAGFSGAEADTLRKVMGKKLKDKMAEWEEKFVEGAINTNGVTEKFAREIFGQIAKFAGYGFNASHAYAYSLLSYISMYLKTYYPAEFYAGLLSTVKEVRRAVILNDMSRNGIELSPPDINYSTDTFEAWNGTTVLCPLSSIKGVSDRTARALMEERLKGKFASIEDVAKRVPGRMCNIAHRTKLDKVGAFASIEPDQPPAMDQSRRRDQVELMPGLIEDAVQINRDMLVDVHSVTELNAVTEEYRACDKCDLAGLCHPKPFLRSKARLMVVIDGPSARDEAFDQMGNSGWMETFEDALDEAGLTMGDVYMTSLIKSPKPEAPGGGTKSWNNQTLAQCPQWLDKEIEILKPSLIVALGSLSVTHLTGLKGQDSVGRVVYDKDRDCNILIGFNVGMIYFRPEKAEELQLVVSKIPALLT